MPVKNIITTIYTNRDTLIVAFPARWVICPRCDGDATTSSHVECDGGGFTASEWAEQDEEFQQDYLAGAYDRPCEYCDGQGRVQVIDEERVTGWRYRILLKAYHAQQCDSEEIDAMQEAERRMGA